MGREKSVNLEAMVQSAAVGPSIRWEPRENENLAESIVWECPDLVVWGRARGFPYAQNKENNRAWPSGADRA